ncbi:hypothetical protein NDU88_002562 [Pleurodeles waltl]|uniref:Uncharacterized protein n=1 Tax=Pleurodeles waltl TaxID=8319 RepID=A0AAV7UBG8_PLEWA|nr:hypothetical protein NDU88_002562 [Pleurodeles waltl]
MLRRPQIQGGSLCVTDTPPTTLRSPCSLAEGLPSWANHPITPVLLVAPYLLPQPSPHRSTWTAINSGRMAQHLRYQFPLCLSTRSQALVGPWPSHCAQDSSLTVREGGPTVFIGPTHRAAIGASCGAPQHHWSRDLGPTGRHRITVPQAMAPCTASHTRVGGACLGLQPPLTFRPFPGAGRSPPALLPTAPPVVLGTRPPLLRAAAQLWPLH